MLVVSIKKIITKEFMSFYLTSKCDDTTNGDLSTLVRIKEWDCWLKPC